MLTRASDWARATLIGVVAAAPVALSLLLSVAQPAAGAPPAGLTNYSKSAYWNLWALQSELQGYAPFFTAATEAYPDTVVPQLAADFAYSVFPLPVPAGGPASFDGIRMDLVLDPAAQGGAHTGTTFGPYGVSVSPDAIYNSGGGIQSFWYYLLSLHETVNVWTGALATGWPWANGSAVWGGQSPFPNMCDQVVLGELGMTAASQYQASRMASDPAVQALLQIQQQYGWGAYQGLFSLTRSNGITSWSVYPEPLRSAIIALFISSGAHASVLPILQAGGVGVTSAAFAQAQALFPAVTI